MISTPNKPRSSARADPKTGAHAWVPPPRALTIIRSAVRWMLVAAIGLCAGGLAVGFSATASDHGRGELFRIAYIHVPATWACLALYALLVFWSCIRLLTGMRLASMMVEAIAPTGALFALLVLWTGSLWSKAVADAWWDWDARRIADLVLLVFFVGCALSRQVLDENARTDAITAVLALAGGVIVVAVTHTIDLVPHVEAHPAPGFGRPAGRVLAALALVSVGFTAYATAVALKRFRCVLLERERASTWVEHWSAR